MFFMSDKSGAKLLHEYQFDNMFEYMDKNKVLFVLDGFDEVHKSGKESIKMLTLQSNFLLTSRPYADIIESKELAIDLVVDSMKMTLIDDNFEIINESFTTSPTSKDGKTEPLQKIESPF